MNKYFKLVYTALCVNIVLVTPEHYGTPSWMANPGQNFRQVSLLIPEKEEVVDTCTFEDVQDREFVEEYVRILAKEHNADMRCLWI